MVAGARKIHRHATDRAARPAPARPLVGQRNGSTSDNDNGGDSYEVSGGFISVPKYGMHVCIHPLPCTGQ